MNLNTNLKFSITFFVVLLPALNVMAQTAGKSNLDGSTLNYNLALKHFNAGKLGHAKAFAEKSLFINPLNSGARKISTLADDSITESLNILYPENIGFLTKVLSFLPTTLSYVFLVFALFLLFYCLGRLKFNEELYFKSLPKLRLKVVGAGTILFLAIVLHLLKVSSDHKQWACVTSSSASLFTGPDSTKFTQTGSLPIGSCVQVVALKGKWASLMPSRQSSGWTKRSDIELVNGYKFDPPIK